MKLIIYQINALIVVTGQLEVTTDKDLSYYVVDITFFTIFNITLIFVAISSIVVLNDLQNTYNNMST